MIVIGITGSIGMGKSTVAQMLRDQGVPVHDSDVAVHALLAAGGAGVAPVAQVFPQALQKDAQGNDAIDRKKLGSLVFGDDAARKKLEHILHPLVRAQADVFLEQERGRGTAMAGLDIPLLFETGGEDRVDVTLCVSAPKEVQEARVMARPGMSAEKFAQIVASQMPDDEKRKRADYVVDTGTSLDDTKKQLEDILRDLRARSMA